MFFINGKRTGNIAITFLKIPKSQRLKFAQIWPTTTYTPLPKVFDTFDDLHYFEKFIKHSNQVFSITVLTTFNKIYIFKNALVMNFLFIVLIHCGVSSTINYSFNSSRHAIY